MSDIIQVELKTLKNLEQLLSTDEWSPYKLKNETRNLYNPVPQHKKALKRLVRALYTIPLPPYLFGGIKSKSYIHNAEVHKDNDFFLIADIEKFFPTTHESYVYDFFKNKMDMATDISKILTLLVTHVHETKSYRYLPQGFPTSPILSFLSYTDMFEELKKFAKKHNLTFSVYYDDITFSSRNFIPKRLKEELTSILNKYSFNLSQDKTKFQKRKTTRVTGVIITKEGLRSPYKLTRKLASLCNELQFSVDNKLLSEKEKNSYLNKIRGYMTAIKAIEPARNLQVYEQQVKVALNTLL